MIGTLLGFLAILILSVSLLYAINLAKASNEEALAINVGVVLPEKDQGLGSMLKFAEGLSSIKGYCNLIKCTEAEARNLLVDKSLTLAIIIPDDFIDKAVHMEPTEFTVLAPSELSHNEKKLFSIFHGVEHMMTVCESAIQSMYVGMGSYSFDFSKTQMEDDLTAIYVNQFMTRNSVFDVEFLSVFGNYSFLQYYSSSIILIFLLVCSISFFGMYGKGELYLEKIFSVSTFGIIKTTLLKIIAQVISLSVLFYIITFIFLAIDKALSLDIVYISSGLLFGIPLLTLAICVYTHLIISFFKCSSDSSIYYILISLLMITVCGGIVPTIYFPNPVKIIGAYLPFSVWFKTVLALFYEGGSVPLLSLLVSTLVMLSVGMALYIRQVKKHG